MKSKSIAWTLLVAVAVTASSTAQSNAAQGASLASINANYGRLPLTFEANRGQAASQVKFLSRGPGYTAFLTSDGMVLSLHADQPAGRLGSAQASVMSPSKKSQLQFHLVGATRNASVVGELPQLGRVNYFVGNNPAKWKTNVPTYAQIRYRSVYPGIDLLYYGNQRQLEYDFAIAPGADPRRIQFEITGAREMHIEADGHLVLATASGDLRFQTPAVYQEANGQRVPVAGGYIVNDPTHISFRVAQYDPTKPLVIDPVLVYSTYLGGSGTDQASGIAVDAAGNVYVAGSTDSADFPLTIPGSLPAGLAHVFVSKLDANGSNLIYTDYIGGSSQDYGYALALDAANNVYVTGSTASSDFPMVNPFQGTYPGAFNAFLTKISSAGSSLLYSTYFGGNGSDLPAGVAVDSVGAMVIAGYTSSTNLATANAYQSTVSANGGGIYGDYGFLTKFSPDGSSLVYSTYFGGSSTIPLNCGGTPCWTSPSSAIAGLVLDAAGNAYVTGATNTYDFPVTSGAYQTTDSTQMNSTVGFVSKFSGGGSLQYSTYFYDPNGIVTEPAAIAVDGSGSAYVTGITVSWNGTFPITSTGICDPSVSGSGCNYGFVTKFDAAGSTLAYSTYLGPNNNAVPQAVVLDGNNDAYVVAYTTSGSFTMVNGIENYDSGNDILLAEIDPLASTQLFATYLGGSGDDSPAPAGLALDASGSLYVAGITDSIDFPVTQSAFQGLMGGNTDAFILKIGSEAAPAVTLSPASLQYSVQAPGTSSAPQTVLLRNMGSVALSISSITTSGDFSETDTCGNNVPAASSCLLSATFSPTGVGSRSGSIVITDDAAGSPHSISLQGSAVGALVKLTPSGVAFSSVSLGSSSGAKNLTLSNSGNMPLNIAGVQVTGDYGQSNNCSTALAAGSTCTINVTFTPTASGTRSGTLAISDDAASSPQNASLSGTGVDFSLASSVPSVTVKAGATASYTLTIASLGGAFANAVKLACSGNPAKTSCGFSSSSVTPGSSGATVTMTISTAGSSAALLAPVRQERNQGVVAAWIQLQGVGLFGLMLAVSKRRSKKVYVFVALVLLLGAMLLMAGCAGGTGIGSQGQTGTTPGTYTITVSGASGTLQHSIPVTLTVQ